MNLIERLSLLIAVFLTGTNSFSVQVVIPTTTSRSSSRSRRPTTQLQKTLKDYVDDARAMVDDAVEEVENVFRRDELKRELTQLGASYDRGYGASPAVRRKVEDKIKELESLNQEKNASRFISGPELVTIQVNTTDGNATIAEPETKEKLKTSPLAGSWRMIWTTASDVLVLGSNPFVTVGAIYQIFEPPIVTNVIDLIPRVQNLLPPTMVPGTLLRAKVSTKASSRNNPMRVGLDFNSVKLQPIELIGQDATSLPPFGFDLPKINLPDDVGYFDVSFLDEEMLIIRQNSPGGLFVLAKVTDSDP